VAGAFAEQQYEDPTEGGVMSERIRRAAANEAMFREINEQIETLEREMAQVSDNNMHIVCECAALSCAEKVVVSISEYERVRSDAALFFVKPSHEQMAVEFVVDEQADYLVVRKRPGEGEQIAEQTDPRSS
jgi:hypothetical protein